MTTNPFFTNWLKNMTPSATQTPIGMPSAPIDMQAFMEQGRKNFQAITEAQQICMESMQVIAQRQAEILSQFVSDQTTIARELAGEMTPEQKIAKGADLIRSSYERTMTGAREVGDMLQKSGREAGDVLNRRVQTALNEIKSTVTNDEAEQTSGNKNKKGKAA